MTQTAPPLTMTLYAAARAIRALYGAHASVILLRSTLTEDAPRSMYAGGLRVFDAQDHEVALPWDAYAGLELGELDGDGQPVLVLEGGHHVPLGSPEVYHAALQADAGLHARIGEELLGADTPFDLVQALNHLSACGAVGWTRLSLPPERSGLYRESLRVETETSLGHALQAAFPELDPVRVQGAAAGLLRGVLGGLGPQGEHARALRAAYGLDPDSV